MGFGAAGVKWFRTELEASTFVSGGGLGGVRGYSEMLMLRGAKEDALGGEGDDEGPKG